MTPPELISMQTLETLSDLMKNVVEKQLALRICYLPIPALATLGPMN